MTKPDFHSYDSHFSPRYATIFLHGLGADASDFKPVAKFLELPPAFSTRFIFINAKPRPVTINGGLVTRAWYDILQLSDVNGPMDQKGLDNSIHQIHQVIAHLEKQGYASDKISIIGFSQGGALAYWAGLTYSKPLRYIVALSAFLPKSEELWQRLGDHHQQKNTPIIHHHGQFDNIVPIRFGEQALQSLKNQGYTELIWNKYMMSHEILPTQIKDLSLLMQDELIQRKSETSESEDSKTQENEVSGDT